jgi:S1-C subfamily serine protease
VARERAMTASGDDPLVIARRSRLVLALLFTCALAAHPVAGREPQSVVPPEAYAAAARAARSVVVVDYVLEKAGRGFGAVGQRAEMACVGTIVGPDGLVVVASNIFPEDEDESREPARPHSFEVRLPDGKRVEASLLGIDKDAALAFLKLEAAPGQTFAAVTFEEGDDMVPGDALLLTSLLPEKYDHQPSFVKAAVAGVIRKPRLLYDVDAFIQDAMICTPVVDARGRATGILTTDPLGETTGRALSAPLKLIGAVTRNKEPGFPVLVPTSGFRHLLAEPPRTGIPEPKERAWLGVTLQPVPRNLADYLRIEGPTGVMITSVWSGSPAEAVGLRPEDIIVGFNGKPVVVQDDSTIGAFIDQVRETPIGTEVRLDVLRGSEKREILLRLGAAPTTQVRAEEYRNETFGLQAQDLTRDIIMSRGWPEDTAGALVTEIETAGWAQVGGLREDDLILAVNGLLVAGVEDLRAHLEGLERQRPPEVVFFVLRDPDTLFVSVKTQW